MVFLDSNGWPVERVNGRRMFNFLRLVIHTRKIIRNSTWKRFSERVDSYLEGEITEWEKPTIEGSE